MNGTRDTDETAAAGNGDGLGPQEAAALLAQTKRRARRKFEPNPPLLSVLRALVVLAAYGAIWLSVRGQHPYKGPNGLVVALLYAVVIVVIAASVAVLNVRPPGSGGSPRRGRPRSSSWQRPGSPCMCSSGPSSTPESVMGSLMACIRPRHR